MAELPETATMRMLYRILLVGCFCVVLAGLGLLTLSDPQMVKKLGVIAGDLWGRMPGWPSGWGVQRTTAVVTGSASPSLPQDFTFPPFTSNSFETAGFSTANRFTGPIKDRGSIEQVCAAIRTRADRGIESCLEELRSIPKGEAGQAFRTVRAEGTLIFLLMYQGKFNEAAEWTERAIADADAPGIPAGLQTNLRALLGVIHLRRGETENCLECMGPSSCIFPIAREAVHLKTSGSREAIRHFTAYLRQRPEDLGVRWLVNVAYMTLGEYPDDVPSDLMIPLDPFRSKLDVGRFQNVAPLVGLGVRGPNMAGGSVFDDFNGDGLPDVFTTSLDLDLGASLFINRGDGTFEDQSSRAGLHAQPYSVNCARPIMTTTVASM